MSIFKKLAESKTLILVIGAVLFFGSGVFSGFIFFSRSNTPSWKPYSIRENTDISGRPAVSLDDSYKIMIAMQEAQRNVAKTVLPVVVEIDIVEVITQTDADFFNPRDFFGDDWPFSPFFDDENKDKSQPKEREYKREGMGSGVIVDKKGNKVYVVSNNHVVGNAKEITVRLYDNREFKARLVGKDKRTDLALIEFETNEEIPIAVLGDSEALMVGDYVYAIGNPFGFESTITSGMISALGRRAQNGADVATYTDYIQTDAPINPGNSGGALVNMWGEVVGINTWIASQSGGSVGLGFAIPINLVKQAVSDFISSGKITYGWLGVSIVDTGAPGFEVIAEELKIKGKSGALVLNLFKISPAYKAGILPGDLITKVDDVLIRDSDHLTRVVGSSQPGETRNFTIIRYGAEKTIKVKLEAREDEDTIEKDTGLWPGMIAQKITDDIRQTLKLDPAVKGVVVVSIIDGSPASVAGFKQGDIITRINNASVGTVMDFYKFLNAQDKNEITFRVYRAGHEILMGLVR